MVVSEWGADHVSVFGPDGEKLGSGKLYVTDTDNNNCFVQVLHSDLTFSSTFGKHGDGKG